MHVRVHVCECVRLLVCMHEFVCMCMCMCMRVSVCVYVGACMLCVLVCVCLWCVHVCDVRANGAVREISGFLRLQL